MNHRKVKMSRHFHILRENAGHQLSFDMRMEQHPHAQQHSGDVPHEPQRRNAEDPRRHLGRADQR